MNLLEALQIQFPESSNSTLRSWLKHGRVFVDGRVEKVAKAPVRPEQEISVGKKKEVTRGKVEILFEDAHLIVVKKPSGLLSVATERIPDQTVHSFLKQYYYPKRVHVVHRLDRDTSGLMVFARTEEAREAFKELLAKHAVEREYVAVVEGQVEEASGTWVSYLADGKDFVVRTSSPENGKKAITHFSKIGGNAEFSLLAFRLETGRKNQIRVHCQEAGHPITGDSKYGAQESPLKRLALHARRLHFAHPITGKTMEFEVEVPRAFFSVTA